MIALELPKVPVPDRVAALIGSQLPLYVLQAEVDADMAVREVLRFRPLDSDEDRADRERELSRLARENKTLAKFHPLAIVRGAA